MRNLRNVEYTLWEQRSHISSACWDSAGDEVLYTVGPTNGSIELVRISRQRELTTQIVATWDHPSPNPDLPDDRVVSIRHFSDTLTTCLVFNGGDVYIVKEADGDYAESEPHIEMVGSIDAGISAAAWSPDEELLAVATKANTILFMSRTFDPIADITMSSEDLKASKHVSVGWGKKETQFQGKGAKALRDPTIPEKVDEGALSPCDDNSTTISWRGDGAYVAVNSIERGSRRVIRVYSRDGTLDSVSEPVDGLEGSLSWKPAGNVIAGIQRLPDRLDVAFFERNGLRHGQFTLRLPEGEVYKASSIRLDWNADSTVLAVSVADTLQLWTMGNYHWYLKQELSVGTPSSGLVWHPEKALRFLYTTADSIKTSEYIFAIARGSLSPPNDYGAVAVIDGKTLKTTPFRTANIPPPMAMFEITVERSIVDVAFNSDNSMMAVLHSGGVDLYNWNVKGARSIQPTWSAQNVTFGDMNIPGLPRQVCFSGKDEFVVLTSGEETWLATFKIADSSATTELVSSERASHMSMIQAFVDSTSAVFCQDRFGKTKWLSDSNSEPMPIGPPVQLPWLEVIRTGENHITSFGLSRNGHLYANSRLLVRNCTSFLVTPTHLIFTTGNHLLKFIHMTNPEDLEVPGDDPEKDERCRSIERGARLVTAIPANMALVLQMPRGNLETIYPRAMVVAGIRQLIDEKSYGRAFSYCRTQRVDMNILYDHRPDQLLANVDLFLEQLKDITYIDLFLSSLREEDVTETMYHDTKRSWSDKIHQVSRPSWTPSGTPSGKVNKICDALLRALSNRKKTNLQNIITAHVCKLPPAVDDGLTLVAELMQEDERTAERAVEHICFLVDVNKLYEHALGLYNLDLTLLVAQQSQKDPREYLPFIQNLHTLSELRRRFEIDDHLGRREKALAHLKGLGDFDILSAYTTKHHLYQDALKLYRYDAPRHKALTDLYAAYLESKSKFREAGLAYESLGNYAKAMTCYRAAGTSCWRECLFTAQTRSPAFSTGALAELATTLADALWEAKDYASAAVIHLEYLSSLEGAIRCLCKGYHFGDAMRLVALKQRPDLLETAVDVGLTDALSSSTEFLADCKTQLLAQVPRILELRKKAAEDPLGFYEGERAGGADLPDNVSVAASSRLSTSASLFTRYTGKDGSDGTVATGVSRATSKNRKREEKKRARGRKGTVYEEEYLVNSVRRLVERVEGAKGEVERLVASLVRRDMAERARAVEALMAEVVEGCRTAIGEVFPVTQGAAGPGNGETWHATGGQATSQVLAEPITTISPEVPVITGLQRLSLLGP